MSDELFGNDFGSLTSCYNSLVSDTLKVIFSTGILLKHP